MGLERSIMPAFSVQKHRPSTARISVVTSVLSFLSFLQIFVTSNSYLHEPRRKISDFEQ